MFDSLRDSHRMELSSRMSWRMESTARTCSVRISSSAPLAIRHSFALRWPNDPAPWTIVTVCPWANKSLIIWHNCETISWSTVFIADLSVIKPPPNLMSRWAIVLRQSHRLFV